MDIYISSKPKIKIKCAKLKRILEFRKHFLNYAELASVGIKQKDN